MGETALSKGAAHWKNVPTPAPRSRRDVGGRGGGRSSMPDARRIKELEKLLGEAAADVKILLDVLGWNNNCRLQAV